MVRSLVAAAMLAAVPAQAFAPGGLVPLRAGLVSPATASSPVQPCVIPALPRRSLSACVRVPSPRAGTRMRQGCATNRPRANASCSRRPLGLDLVPRRHCCACGLRT